MKFSQKQEMELSAILNRRLGFDDISTENRKMPVCVCMDSSYSMSEDSLLGSPRIEEAKKGVRKLISFMSSDRALRNMADVCVITYNGNGIVNLTGGFVPAKEAADMDFSFDTFGESPMFTAVDKAVDMVNAQRDGYKKGSISAERGWVILITDGRADDYFCRNGMISVNVRSKLEKNKKNVRLVCGCFGYETKQLDKLTTPDNIRNMEEFSGIYSYFTMLSQSLSVASRAI